MELEQEGNTILSVSRGHNQQWHVTRQDYQQPLASFPDPQTACAWAISRAKPEQGKVFVESIPLTWANAGNTRTGSAGQNAPHANSLVPFFRDPRR